MADRERCNECHCEVSEDILNWRGVCYYCVEERKELLAADSAKEDAEARNV